MARKNFEQLLHDLLSSVLSETQPEGQPEGQHVSDEEILFFYANGYREGVNDDVVGHLAECKTCAKKHQEIRNDLDAFYEMSESNPPGRQFVAKGG